MNPNQPLWLRISHNNQPHIQVQVTDFMGATAAIFESYIQHKTPSTRKVQMVIELSNQPFTSNSLLSRDQQIEQDLLTQTITDPSTIMYPPDVTLAEVTEAFASPEGEAMFKYQRAENRIGIDPQILLDLRTAYESKFPRVAPHGPLWTTS